MIIVPTEKRFDWQNAPIVLFFIVILNVLVFYAYQTGDSEYFDEAFSIYVNDGIYEKELPLYQDFLNQGNDYDKKEFFKEIVQHPNQSYIASYMLQDDIFYAYMLENGADLFEPDYYDYWLYQREHIHDLMFGVSYKKHGLVANDIQLTSLITHQFLHGGTMHLIGNMFFLIICGFAVEASLGHKKFLLFYLLTGVGGGLAQALMDLESSIPLIGASGAVSGVMAMYLGIFRMKKIEFFYWFFVFVGYFRAPALFVLPFYIGNELVSLWTQPDTNVAFIAHVGGFVTGAILIGLVVWQKPETLNQEYIEEDQTIAPAQLSLDKIYQSMEKFQFESAFKLVNHHINEFGADFNLKVLKYKLLQILKPDQAQPYFNQMVTVTRPNGVRLAKIKKMLLDIPKAERQLDSEAQYKLVWNFIAVPEHIDEAVNIFQQMYQADKKHSSLNVLAKKISLTFKQLDNVAEKNKYLAIAEELS